MSNKQRDKEAGKPEYQTREVDKERDSMAPKKKTKIIEDQEINDCKLSDPIKNISEMKEGDQESNGKVDTEFGTIDIQEIIMNEVKNEEKMIVISDVTSDNTTNSGGKTVRVSTLTKRETLISKKLPKSDLTRNRGYGLWLPREQVREKLYRHISAPALSEGKYVTLVDHQGQEWDMLLVCKNEDLYFLEGHWYDYADLYNLVVSDTIVIERVSKLQVKEKVDCAAVSEIGDHDWDAIFPPNSTWQIEHINAEDVEQPDELAEQIEIRDIGKAELVGVMYEITIKRGT
ncbi:hypothetical protein RND71_005463 [Anisodus tanguticus]|uniref:Uncharacterized protein n=1 Tax=Anisodus tanguticus TaxID=243964 RepID=A0AAE1VSD9_9SOLA|nr:hypothetical protein RND71_005463 [Anisodus tanguticus]